MSSVSAAAVRSAHPREDALLRAIESRADELTALTRDLIRFPP